MAGDESLSAIGCVGDVMLEAWRATVPPVTQLAALPAATQSEPTPGPNENVVTGDTEPPTRHEVFDQALEVTRVDPGKMYEESLARLVAPLCPQVTGLDDNLAAEMVARIRANAERVDVRV